MLIRQAQSKLSKYEYPRAALPVFDLKTAEKVPHLYLAYGSNLNKRQMAERCPFAVPLRTVLVNDCRLVFRGTADIEYRKGSILGAGLYEITDQCEQALDYYEGHIEQAPAIGKYRKIEMTLEDGTDVITYIMNRGSIAPPREEYYRRVRQGFKDHNLKLERLTRSLTEAY